MSTTWFAGCLIGVNAQGTAGGLLIMRRKMETSKQQRVFLCLVGQLRGNLIIEKNSSDEWLSFLQSGPTKKPQLYFFFGPAQIFSKSSDVEVEKF
jgi:hypothetical protein